VNPNDRPDTFIDDEPTLREDPTEPFVPAFRGASSPWSTVPKRPLIFTPLPEEIDFEGAIESLTETKSDEVGELVEWREWSNS